MIDDAEFDHFDQLLEAADRALAAGDREQAAHLLDQAHELAEAMADAVVKGIWLNNLALLQLRAGDAPGAHAALRAAITLLPANDFPAELAHAHKNLGFVERELGNLASAAQHHQTALAYFTTLDDPAGVAAALIDLGIVYKDQGRLTAARTTMEQALAQLPIDADPRLRGHAWVSLGLTFALLHRAQEAAAAYHQALTAYQAAGDRENEALTLHNLGALADNQQDIATALAYYRQALTLNLAINSVLGITEDLSALAALYQLGGQWEAARQLHQEVLRHYTELRFPSGQLHTLIDLGIVERAAGNLAQAEATFAQALTLAQTLDAPGARYQLYLNRGDTRLMAERFSAAADDYRAAADTVEALRTRLFTAADALAYFDEARLEVYDRLVRLHARVLQNSTVAFQWNERARARSFLQQLRLTALRAPAGIDASLLVREAQLLDQLRQLADALSTADGGEVSAAPLVLLTAYDTLQTEIQALWDELTPTAPEYVALRRGEPPTWQDVRHGLS